MGRSSPQHRGSRALHRSVETPDFSADRNTDPRDYGPDTPGSCYQYEPPTATDLQRVLQAAEQGGDPLFLSSVAWLLGHTLMDHADYAAAAACFHRVLLAARSLGSSFLEQAARVAVDLCNALHAGDPARCKQLRLARSTLSRSLLQLGDEDLLLADEALAEYRAATSLNGARRQPPADLSARLPAGSAVTNGKVSPTGSEKAASSASAPSQRVLRAHLFGRFELFHNGRQVCTGHHRKALAILKYLLAHEPHAASRDYLLGWLWPESSSKRARWSLNSAIYALRRLLDDCLPPVAPPGYVLFEDNLYRLSSLVGIISDTSEFDASYESGLRLEKDGRSAEAVEEYTKAVDLYRDDFLTDDLYEDWTMVERERLSNAYVDAMSRIAVHAMQASRTGEGTRICHQILEKDPCHERAHRMLMECYARQGLITRALHQYEFCQRLLKQRYGIEPSTDTRSLRERLLGREF